MENLTITEIVGAFAIIVAIYNFYILVKKVYLQPTQELENKMNAKLDSLQKEQRLILKAVYQLSLHQVTGNHITDMEALNKEIQDHLVK